MAFLCREIILTGGGGASEDASGHPPDIKILPPDSDRIFSYRRSIDLRFIIKTVAGPLPSPYRFHLF